MSTVLGVHMRGGFNEVDVVRNVFCVVHNGGFKFGKYGQLTINGASCSGGPWHFSWLGWARTSSRHPRV